MNLPITTNHRSVAPSPVGAAGRPDARSPALDGLRGIAVAAVVYRHLGLPGLYGGGVGVFAFFTLSGFIITFLLCVEFERPGTIRLGAFWMRRIRRLLPALLLAVALGVALARATTTAPIGESLGQALPALAYFSNWWRIWANTEPGNPTLGPFDHTWSLSIEEQFYLTWPVLFLLVMRYSRHRLRHVVMFTLALAATSAATRWLAFDPTQPVSSAYVLYNRTDSEAELLLVGAAAGMLAWYFVRHPETRNRLRGASSVAGTLGLLILIAAFALQPGPEHPNRMQMFWTGGLTLIALGVSAICVQVFLNPSCGLARLLGVAPLPQLGRISYGIYLYHYPYVYFVLPLFPDGRALGALVVIGLTLLTSTASWWLVERPIINLGKLRSRRRHPDRDQPADPPRGGSGAQAEPAISARSSSAEVAACPGGAVDIVQHRTRTRTHKGGDR